jgi:hypothetical protein
VKESANTYKSQKLIRIFLKYEKDTIRKIVITGDFFIHPEESLERLEEKLVGTKLEKNAIVGVVERSLADSQVFGFDSLTMTEAILGCLDK